MKTMNMPGFTAEACLSAALVQNRGAVTGKDLVDDRSVMPQLPIGFCQANCDPDDWICLIRCMDNDGGGSGPRPPKPYCRPACGRCLPDEDSPTGRSRLCIKANCDDYVRYC